MRLLFLTVTFLACILIFLSACTADQIPGTKNQSENIWNGTWESDYYTLFIQQDGSSIEGIYEPFNISENDPGLLQGNLSADGRIFSGIWTETGSVEFVLSDDKMSYSGVGSVRPDVSLNESGGYNAIGTRMEESFNPDLVWNGTWKTKRVMNTLTQNRSRITGSYEPLYGIEDEPGLFEGVVSDDGKTLSGTWTENGNFTFIISDEGSFWNGTYDLGQNTSAGSDIWNATKLQ